MSSVNTSVTLEDIKEYLKENLLIQVSVNDNTDYYGNVYKSVDVKLLLENEVVCESRDSA